MISESTLLVRPEHLNHHGYLFGGRLLEWLDEQAYIAAISRLKPEANLVTVAIDKVEFKVSVEQGSLLLFRSEVVHAGRTSLTVLTQVFKRQPPKEELIFRAYVTFVCLNAKGKPGAIAPYFIERFERATLRGELAKHWDAVERARKLRRV
jgi:acyl-CoA hydrolase